MQTQRAAFWQYLLESIYGNVLGQADTMDLCALFMNEGAATQPLLRQLLDAPSLSLDIVTTEESGAPSGVKGLYFEAANRQKLEGAQTLCFGYPLFARPDANSSKGLIAMPVFLWQLQIQPSQTQTDIYQLTRTFHQYVRPNPLFVQYLQKEMGITDTKNLYDVCANNKITAEKLNAACNQVALALGIETSSSAYNIQRLPEAETLKTAMHGASGSFVWSGVLGVFSTLGIQNLRLLDKLAESDQNPFLRQADAPPSKSNLQHSFSDSLLVNTRQEAVLRGIAQHQRVAVYAPAGSGKTDLIHAIITNALANGAKCLVVSPLNTTISAVQSGMEKYGYKDLTLRIQEQNADKLPFINALQTAVASAKTNNDFQNENYQLAIASALRYRQKLDKSYNAIAQPLLQTGGWTEMVGQFLSNQYKEGKHVLNGYLSPKSWTFNATVLQTTLTELQVSRRLYDGIRSLEHPLAALHPTIFVNKENQEAFDYVHATNADLLRDARRLHSNINKMIEEYADNLESYYYKYYLQLNRETAAIREDLGEYNAHYGKDFNEKGALKSAELFVKGLFSKKHKGIITVKDEVQKRYDRLLGTYNKRPFFKHGFSVQKNNSFEGISQELGAFDHSLNAWRESLTRISREDAFRLSANSAHAETGLSDEIASLEAEYQSLIEQINVACLYETAFDNSAHTLPLKKTSLETIINRLETTERYLRDFDAFYAWQSHWLQQPEYVKDVVRALVKTKPADWDAAFSSWFLHQMLAQQPHDLLLEDDDILKEYERVLTKVVELLPRKIHHIWDNRQADSVRNLKSNNKALYNELCNFKDNAMLQARSLGELINLDFKTLTESFPVMLMSPHIVADFFPEAAAYFDVVIIDDADKLVAGRAIGSLWRGKHQIVIAENDVPADSSPSLWNFVKNAGFERYDLYQIYHKTHPKFSAITNALFHEHKLEILPTNLDALNAVSPMRLKQVNGVYYPEQRTNEDEAQEIIKLLNNVTANNYNNFPSVGIICFTYEQRNLISDYLQRIKQQKQAGFDRILQLEKCGLGVFHCSELEGVNRDIVLVSTTYGLDYLQTLTADIAELQQPIWENYLQMLCATPNARVDICTSVPHEFIQKQIKRDTNDGLRILSIYLKYAENVEDCNELGEKQLLDAVTILPPAAKFVLAPSFNEQVRNELSKYLDPNRIETNVWIDNLPVDLVIRPIKEGAPAVAVITDGFFSRGAYDTFARESAYIKRLQANGYIYYPLYTRQWWRQPSIEARKLAGGFIAKESEAMA
jgi:RecA/RadA recombinase